MYHSQNLLSVWKLIFGEYKKTVEELDLLGKLSEIVPEELDDDSLASLLEEALVITDVHFVNFAFNSFIGHLAMPS